MSSGWSLLSSGEWRRDKASALMFFDPGRYEMEKLNRVKNRAHLAWRGLSLFASRRYSKFLWSVSTVKECWAPSNQCLHSSRASFIARSSLLPMSLFFSTGLSLREKAAHGCSRVGVPCCWDKKPPTPVVDTSTSAMNGLQGSGWTRIGALIKASLSLWKASVADGVQYSDLGLFFRRFVRGLLMVL